MTTIYVREQQTTVRRQGERIVVTKQGSVLDEFPLANVEQVVLMGNVQLTQPAAARLMERKIDVVFLTRNGKYIGRMSGDLSNHARLRQAQLRTASDEATRLAVARAIVDGKIHNQRVILLRQTQPNGAATGRGSAGPRDRREFEKGLAGMMEMRRAAVQATNVDSLRGHEGKAAAYYFAALRALLDPAWKFEKRIYHPAPDPFNALLSFAYSLLQKDMTTAINLVGFDPYLGYFHAIDDGRPALPLDLMEEWRPLVADAMVLELVNRGSLRPENFTWTGRVSRPVELGTDGITAVLNAYGRRLETELYHPLAGPPEGGNTSTQRALTLQVRRLARMVLGELPAYEAVKAK